MLALIERCQLLARADAAAKELEMRTMIAFFDHLAGRPVDPRITRQFATQSSGWRVPWSASEQPGGPRVTTLRSDPEAMPTNFTVSDLHEQVLPPVRASAPGYVRLGRARPLREQ